MKLFEGKSEEQIRTLLENSPERVIDCKVDDLEKKISETGSKELIEERNKVWREPEKFIEKLKKKKLDLKQG